MYENIVGGLKIAPSEFWNWMTIGDCSRAVKGHNRTMETDKNSMELTDEDYRRDLELRRKANG